MGAVRKVIYNKDLRKLVPLDSLPSGSFEEVAAKAAIEDIRAGRILFKAGDEDRQFLYVLQGELELLVENRVVETLVGGTDAARYPVSPQQPRQVTARAKTRLRVARIDTGLLDVLMHWDQSTNYEVQDLGAEGDEDWLARLLRSEVCKRLPPTRIQQVLTRIEPVAVKAGEVVIRQGDEGDYFYIIKSGRCIVSRKPSPRTRSIKLAELSEGDSFGEEALLLGATRNATVTMAMDGCLMRLSKQDFEELLQESMAPAVDIQQARQWIGEGAIWLDVRLPKDFIRRALQDSINIPLALLRDKAGELNRQSRYIVCCETGHDSACAVFLLSQMGYSAYWLKNGLRDLPQTVFRQGDGTAALPPAPTVKETAVEQPESHDEDVAVEIAQAETAALHAKLRAVRAGHEQAMAEADRRMASLEQALEQAQLRERDASSAHDHTKKELRQLAEKLESAYTDAELHTRQLEESRQALSRAEQEAAAWQDRTKELQAGAESRQEKLTAEFAELRRQSDQEIESLREALAEAGRKHDQNDQDNQTRIAALEEALETERVQRQDVETSHVASEERTAGLKAQLEAERGAREELRGQWQDERGRLQSEQHELAERLSSTEAGLREAEQERESLRGEVEQARSSLEQLHRQLEAAKRQGELARNEWQGEREDLQATHSSLQERSRVLEERNQALQQQLREREHERDEARSNAEQQAESLERLRSQLTATESEAEGEVLVLREQLQSSRQRARDLEEELEHSRRQWTEELADRDRRDQHLKEQLEAAEATGAKQTEESRSALETLRDEVSNLREALREAKEQETGLRENSEVQSREISELQKQISELERRLTLAGEERDAAQRQYRDLQEALADSREVSEQERATWQQQLDGSINEQDALRSQLETAGEELGQVRARLEEVEQARSADAAAFEERERALQQEHDRLSEEREAAAGEREQFHAQMDSLRAELVSSCTQSGGELDRLNGELEEARKEMQQTRQELADQDAERQLHSQKLETREEELRTENEHLVSERDEARSRVEEKDGEIAALRERLAVLEAEGKGEQAALREEAQAAREQSREAAEKLERQTTEYRSLKAELSVRRDQESVLRAEIEAIQKREVQTTTRLREELEQARSRLKEPAAPAEPAEDRHDREMESLRQELDAARSALNDLEFQASEREQALQAALEQQQLRAERELQSVQEQLRNAQEEITPQGHATEPAAGEQPAAAAAVDTPEEPESPREQPDAGEASSRSAAAAPMVESLRPIFRPRYLVGTMVLLTVAAVAVFQVLRDQAEEEIPASAQQAAVVAPAKVTPAGDDSGATPSAQASSVPDAAAVAKPAVAPEKTTAKPAPRPSSAPPAVRGRPLRDRLADGSSGPLLLELRGGRFEMGSGGSSPNFDERPRHTVTVSGFAIGKYEVTFAEYDRFARATGRALPNDRGWGRDKHPAINVSWKDAVAYTEWLSEQTGHVYRLPTEAEWEYAARAGTTALHWWGTGKPNANCFDCSSVWGGTQTAPVGRFGANPFGIHDTAGNVAEWVQDCYVRGYRDAPADGRARTEENCAARVVRGGSYASPVSSVRSAKRTQRPEQTLLDTLGFRVVRRRENR